jgi:hypothetical protein
MTQPFHPTVGNLAAVRRLLEGVSYFGTTTRYPIT